MFNQVAVWPSGKWHLTHQKNPAWLVLRWANVCGCNQSLRPTQPPTLTGMGNEYQPRHGVVTMLLPRKVTTGHRLTTGHRHIHGNNGL